MSDEFVTIAVAAKLAKMHPQTLRGYAREGKVRRRFMHSRLYLYHSGDAAALAERQQIACALP